jgi:trimeric autotransporter adhesin
MNIKTCSLLVCLFTGIITRAQVAFNTSGATPNNSAMLDVTSYTKGLLAPRMTTAQRTAITSPATGLLVFDNTLSLFYYYNGTAWTPFNAAASPAWSLLGNSGAVSGTNFLGTTDNQALDFKTNKILHTRIRPTGHIEVFNIGGSTYLGQNAGAYDDMNNRFNTSVGYSTLRLISSGKGNTVIGAVGCQVTKTNNNTAAGSFALGNGDGTGTTNTALGYYALNSTTSGSYNTAAGASSLQVNNTGSYNIGLGTSSLYGNTAGSENVGIGSLAARYNSTGNYNIAIGPNTMFTNIAGNKNIVIGSNADVTADNLTNAIAIGNSAQVAQSNSLVLGGTGANAVMAGIGTTTPLSTLEVTGTTGLTIKSAQVAGTNNPDNTASIWHYTSGTGAITLPAAASYSNRLFVIVNQTGATLNTSSYNNLAGAAQTTLATGTSIMIVSNGTAWLRIR